MEVASLANISDGPASGGSSGSNNNGLKPVTNQLSQLSPPQPVSTLQHNYSNIQQPIPRPSSNSLTSSRTQSSNASPSLIAPGSPFLPALPPTGPPPPVPGEAFGAFSRSAVRPRTPNEHSERSKAADRSKLVEINDLIHLEPPLTEDSVIRTLQARFFHQKHFVSFLLLKLVNCSLILNLFSINIDIFRYLL
jgi:hypothetical protein